MRMILITMLRVTVALVLDGGRRSNELLKLLPVADVHSGLIDWGSV